MPSLYFIVLKCCAGMVKLADTQDLSSCFSNEVWVQVPQVVLSASHSMILFVLVCYNYYIFLFYGKGFTFPSPLKLQSKSVRYGADLLSHAILYWIEFRILCFALKVRAVTAHHVGSSKVKTLPRKPQVS